jgi:hypothetical protein
MIQEQMMEEVTETNMQPPVVAVTPEKPFGKLRQITVHTDEEIEEVNALLSDSWRLVSIGFRPDATVYVLGQMQEKRRQRAGFGFMRAEDEPKEESK